MVITYPIGLVVSTVGAGAAVLPGVHAAGVGDAVAGRDPLRLRTRADTTRVAAIKQDADARQMFRQF
jgi:hypothetical protein